MGHPGFYHTFCTVIPFAVIQIISQIWVLCNFESSYLLVHMKFARFYSNLEVRKGGEIGK